MLRADCGRDTFIPSCNSFLSLFSSSPFSSQQHRMAFYIRSLLAPLRSLSSTNEDLLPMKVEDGTISSSTHGSLAGPWRYFKRIALAVVPSPIQRRLAPHLSKPSRIHSTSWLDGLRGLASLIVFLHHYTCIYVAPYKGRCLP